MAAVVVEDENVELKGDEFFRIMAIYKKKWVLVLTIIMTMLTGIAPLLTNIVIGNMVTLLTQQTDFVEEIKKLVLDLLYIIIVMIVLMAISIYLRFNTNPEYLVDLRSKIYEKLMSQDIAYFDATPTGVLIGRLSEDVTLIREVYIDKFLMVVQYITQSVAGIILAFITSWRVTLSVIAAIPLSGIAFLIGDHFANKLWVDYNDSTSACSEKAEEVITSFRIVKAFDNELKEADEYSNRLAGVDAVFNKTSIIHGIKDGFIKSIIDFMIAGLLFYCCWLMVNDPGSGIVPGDMMILMMSIILGTMGISQTLSTIDDFKKAQISAAKVLQILAEPSFIDNKAGLKDIKIVGKVEFRDVCFKYNSRDDYAINHLNMVINAGETVALVGESGCGKSTTLQLLQRFYDIQYGEILIDGRNITEFSPEYIRSQISIVPQGPVLFSMSIKENIRYSKPGADSTEVAQAAQVGNAHNFIMELPSNYNTIVQQTSLSGGQKQRICISRAILANAPILLLDEATAALDTESELLVQQSLEQFRHGKTAIVVAHRLATVMNADRIFVFANGKVIESGNHKDLMAKNGYYAELVKFQLE